MAILERQGKHKLALGTVVRTRAIPKDMLPKGAALRAYGHDPAGNPLWIVQRIQGQQSAARGEAPTPVVYSSPTTAPVIAETDAPAAKIPAYSAACEVYRWDTNDKLEREFAIRNRIKRLQRS